jgi:acetyltransferase-like isoleucine patch superfamily enzyme
VAIEAETPSRLWSLADKATAIKVWVTSRVSAFLWLRVCDEVGPNTRTYWRPHIENRGRITIGSRVRINSHWAPVQLVTGPEGVIEIADGVYINYGSLISAQRRIRIGADVMVGNFAIIGDTDVPGIGEPRRGPALEAREIEIGDGAWLAARVTVLPGVRIGAGAVIAAGSVVAEDIPPHTVAGGIPARPLRSVTASAVTSEDGPAAARA